MADNKLSLKLHNKNDQSNTIKNDRIFITIKGIGENITTGQDSKGNDIIANNDQKKECFAQFNSITKNWSYVVVEENTDSRNYSYKLSDVLSNGSIDLGHINSGRMFISIDNPIKFDIQKGANGNVSVAEPNILQINDPNYYVLYDKVEFSFNDGGVWANLTSVDYFSLPLVVYVDGGSSVSMTGPHSITATREELIGAIKSNFNRYTYGKTDGINNAVEAWDKLFITYNGPVSDGSVGDTVLRVISPGKAVFSTHSDSKFPDTYLGSYVDKIWEYYKNNTLQINCGELIGDKDFQTKYLSKYGREFGEDRKVFVGQVNNAGEFVFKNNVPNADEVKFLKPTKDGATISTPFFAGILTTTNYPADTAPANHTIDAILSREICAAFDVGLLCKTGSSVLSKEYFSQLKGKFFQHKPELCNNNEVSYDVYSKVIHDLMLTYAFAYDDTLGQDGTISGKDIRTLYIDIGSMTNTKIPVLQPKDDTEYNVSFVLGHEKDKSPYNVRYNGNKVEGSELFKGKAPLSVECDIDGKGEKYSTMLINLKPYYIDFPEQDTKIAGADVDVNGENITVKFPAPPKDYYQTPKEYSINFNMNHALGKIPYNIWFKNTKVDDDHKSFKTYESELPLLLQYDSKGYGSKDAEITININPVNIGYSSGIAAIEGLNVNPHDNIIDITFPGPIDSYYHDA